MTSAEQSQPIKQLITGGKDSPLLPELRHAIARARVIEISVAFIKHTGLDLIFADLCDFLVSERFERLTFLTSDYLCVTDPTALRKLMLLVERGAEVKVYQVNSKYAQSFHLKAYLFTSTEDGQLATADAFIGSSNISRMALTDGFEWNYRIHYPNKQDASSVARITEIRSEFHKLLKH
ncbi:MAG: phospholipase D-like domain-containing protein, partial [Reinekea sp.]|nr:phospholipase D-like domain-containing protein [Reinekea sp.]